MNPTPKSMNEKQVKHICSECGKDFMCTYYKNYLEKCPNPDKKYLCAKCKNKAEKNPIPKFGEKP